MSVPEQLRMRLGDFGLGTMEEKRRLPDQVVHDERVCVGGASWGRTEGPLNQIHDLQAKGPAGAKALNH